VKETSASICSECRGSKRAGTTTFTTELGFGVVVIRNVPALFCAQCRTDWIADEEAARTEELVEDAKKKHYQVEVTTLS
jgi:YgiT-type zinc finger domain-containing protein